MSAKKLKVYVIPTAVTAGSISLKKIGIEIASSGYISGEASVSKSGDNLEVWGGTLQNETGLNALVQAHTPYAEGEDESKLTAKELRDKMVTEDLPNWGSLSTERKQALVKNFVWPENTPESELNALVPEEERCDCMCMTCNSVITDTPVIKSSSGPLAYWMLTVDENGVNVKDELLSHEVF